MGVEERVAAVRAQPQPVARDRQRADTFDRAVGDGEHGRAERGEDVVALMGADLARGAEVVGHRGGPVDGEGEVAAGQATPDATQLVLTATRGQTEYGICSTSFLEQAFRTDSYRIEVTFNPDGSWSYVLDTMLMVHGRSEPFAHRDVNTLVKVAEPVPNPLMTRG